MIEREKLYFESKSVNDTMKLGTTLARILPAKAIVSLNGPLGSGKTVLAKSLISKATSVNQNEITSPAFSLVNEYTGMDNNTPVLHMDFYRLNSLSEDDFEMYSEFFDSDFTLCVVEWGDKFLPEFLAPDVHIEFSYDLLGEEKTRNIEIVFTNSEILNLFKHELSEEC